MYGFIVLATAWAPGILTVVTFLVLGHFNDFDVAIMFIVLRNCDLSFDIFDDVIIATLMEHSSG